MIDDFDTQIQSDEALECDWREFLLDEGEDLENYLDCPYHFSSSCNEY